MNTWIEDIADWRQKVTQAPKPFTTPAVEDAAIYLVEEAGELLAAVHALSRPDDLRNPESRREAIIDEIGDVLLMLGTVALLANVTTLKDDGYSRPLPGPTTAMKLLHAAISVWDAIHYDDMPYLFCRLDQVFHWTLIMTRAYSISFDEALTGTMTKIEKRAGL